MRQRQSVRILAGLTTLALLSLAGTFAALAANGPTFRFKTIARAGDSYTPYSR